MIRAPAGKAGKRINRDRTPDAAGHTGHAARIPPMRRSGIVASAASGCRVPGEGDRQGTDPMQDKAPMKRRLKIGVGQGDVLAAIQ